MKHKIFLFSVYAIFLFFAGVAFADWIEVEADGTKTLISGKKIRIFPSDAEDQGMIIDAGTGLITMLDPHTKTYTTGTPEEFCAAYKRMPDAEFQKLSEEERRVMEHMMSQVQSKKKNKPKVSIEKEDRSDKIAGFSTQKFTVFVDEMKYEELWLANVEVMSENDAEAFQKIMSSLSFCMVQSLGMEGMAEIAPELSPEYMELMKQGWLMKSVSHATPLGGPAVETEVKELKKQNVDASEFAPPKEYQKLSTDQFVRSGMTTGKTVENKSPDINGLDDTEMK